MTLTVKLLGVNDNPPTVPDYDRQIIEGDSRFNPDLVVAVYSIIVIFVAIS